MADEIEQINFITDGMIHRDFILGKYVFWDIDGTLAPYRFNGHVADPDGTKNGQSLAEIHDGIFLKRKPSKLMQNVVKSCGACENIVLGHCWNRKEIDDKHAWLDEHYPCIKNRIFVYQDESKADAIIDYCNQNSIDLTDVIFVDDVIPFLQEAERKGISAWHVSSFFDWLLE